MKYTPKQSSSARRETVFGMNRIVSGSCSGVLRIHTLRTPWWKPLGLPKVPSFEMKPGVGILPGHLAYYFPLSGSIYFTFSKSSPNKVRREDERFWCPPPVWNLRAAVWFHYSVCSLVICLGSLLLLTFSSSAFGPFSCLLSGNFFYLFSRSSWDFVGMALVLILLSG